MVWWASAPSPRIARPTPEDRPADIGPGAGEALELPLVDLDPPLADGSEYASQFVLGLVISVIDGRTQGKRKITDAVVCVLIMNQSIPVQGFFWASNVDRRNPYITVVA